MFYLLQNSVAMIFWINLCFVLCNTFLFAMTMNKFDLSKYNWPCDVFAYFKFLILYNQLVKSNFQYLWFLGIWLSLGQGLSIINLIFSFSSLSSTLLWVFGSLYPHFGFLIIYNQSKFNFQHLWFLGTRLSLSQCLYITNLIFGFLGLSSI